VDNFQHERMATDSATAARALELLDQSQERAKQVIAAIGAHAPAVRIRHYTIDDCQEMVLSVYLGDELKAQE